MFSSEEESSEGIFFGDISFVSLVLFDNKTESRYACNVAKNIWMSYDDPESLGIKVDYLRSKKLAGAMFWSLDTDDFPKGYPLVTSVSQRLKNS